MSKYMSVRYISTICVLFFFFSVFRNLLYSCTLFIPWCPQMMMVCVLLSHGTRKLPFMWKSVGIAIIHKLFTIYSFRNPPYRVRITKKSDLSVFSWNPEKDKNIYFQSHDVWLHLPYNVIPFCATEKLWDVTKH